MEQYINRCGTCGGRGCNQCSNNGCLKFISPQCVIVDTAYECLGILAGATLEDTLAAIELFCEGSGITTINWSSFNYYCLPVASTAQSFVESISSFVCNLNTQVTTNTSSINTLNGEVTTLNTEVTTLNTEVSTLTTEVNTLLAKKSNYLYFNDISTYPIHIYNLVSSPATYYTGTVASGLLPNGGIVRIKISGNLTRSTDDINSNILQVKFNSTPISTTSGGTFLSVSNGTGASGVNFYADIVLSSQASEIISYSTTVYGSLTSGSSSNTTDTKSDIIALSGSLNNGFTINLGGVFGGSLPLTSALTLLHFSINIEPS